jgi:hypothetical protein
VHAVYARFVRGPVSQSVESGLFCPAPERQPRREKTMTDLPRTMLPTIVPGLVVLLAPQAAQAHLGHIGEMAGHSHWLGYGALAAAAAALALLPKKRKAEEAKEEDTAQDAGQDAGEGQEEAA